MTQERYNELNKQCEKQPDSVAAYDKWRKELGAEYDEWCRLDDELREYISFKQFERALRITLSLSGLYGIKAEKIKPMLEDLDFLRFIRQIHIAGGIEHRIDEDPLREIWEKEFFNKEANNERTKPKSNN